MKKAILFLSFLVLIFSLSFTSCVSSKKFKASEANIDDLKKVNANTQSQLASSQSQLANAQSQLNDCNTKVKNLTVEQLAMIGEYALVQNDLKALSAQSKSTIADQARRLKTLSEIIQAQKDVMANLKNSIADALMKYKADELYVYLKNGNVYVALEEKLLFKSGSEVVDPKGKEALKSLANVLNNTKDITVMIEGHTDNVPIKTSLYKDNWDLSTARATSIVRILTVEDGFDASRITASGRGLFHPVKTNETEEGRAGNRRIEVILSPDLNKIYELLYQ